MMRQLGITALLPGPSGDEQAPNHANIDESKAGPVGALPDPLTLKDGRRVADAKSWFAGKKAHADITAFRNGTLQGGYFILAARALGLDCGPMSGFNNAGVDAEFFAGTEIKSNFLCNLAFGDPSGVYPRSPRFDFDEMARII